MSPQRIVDRHLHPRAGAAAGELDQIEEFIFVPRQLQIQAVAFAGENRGGMLQARATDRQIRDRPGGAERFDTRRRESRGRWFWIAGPGRWSGRHRTRRDRPTPTDCRK